MTPRALTITMSPAAASERRLIEGLTSSGEPVASDTCIVVRVGGAIVGWGDDYGSFHSVPTSTSAGELEAAAEQMLEAAGRLWAVAS